MTFAEELRSKEKEPLQPKPVKPSKEELEKQARYADINSGVLTKEFVTRIKKELLRDLDTSRLHKISMSRNYTFNCTYRPDQYKAKEKEYRTKYIYNCEEDIQRKTKQKAYLNYFLPHRVFSLEEIELLKKQLSKALVAEGFRVAFEVKEFKFKICNGMGLAIPKISYGYTMNITIHW